MSFLLGVVAGIVLAVGALWGVISWWVRDLYRPPFASKTPRRK